MLLDIEIYNKAPLFLYHKCYLSNWFPFRNNGKKVELALHVNTIQWLFRDKQYLNFQNSALEFPARANPNVKIPIFRSPSPFLYKFLHFYIFLRNFSELPLCYQEPCWWWHIFMSVVLMHFLTHLPPELLCSQILGTLMASLILDLNPFASRHGATA